MSNLSGMSDTSKLYVVEERVNGHELRLEKLEENIPLLSRIEAILEAQVELNKTQNLQLDLQSKQSTKTFEAINQNLIKLTHSHDRLQEDMINVKNKVKKVDEISSESLNSLEEKFNASIEKRKIDTSDWGVKIFYWGVLVVSTILLGWATMAAGLN